MRVDSVSKSASSSASTSASASARSSANSSSSAQVPFTSSFRDSQPFANIMVEFEPNTREMAVDVPDSFIARTKTPPKYPPPPMLQPGQYGSWSSSHGRGGGSGVGAGGGGGVNGVLVKRSNPVTPPSRDHLRIEKDGVLVNTMSGPTPPPAKPTTASSSGGGSGGGGGYYVRPDEQQSLRIKKYSEEIARKNLEQERRQRDEQFLRHSVRNSQKMNALKENGGGPNSAGRSRSGLTNNAFVSDDHNHHPEGHEWTPIPDMSAMLEAAARLKKQGSSTSSAAKVIGADTVSVIDAIVNHPDFVRALTINQKLQALHPSLGLSPLSLVAQDLTEECINELDALERDDTDEVTHELCKELSSILCSEAFEGLLCTHDKIASSRMEPVTTSPAHLDEEALLDRLRNYTEPNIKVVRIEKTAEPLGATVKNEDDSVVVGRIIRGGTAEATGLLHEGDEILEVNEVPLRGKNVNEVCDLMASMTGTLTLLVVPARFQPQLTMPVEIKAPIMHVKAHIDYDPEDDPYLPCKELGIGFRKGDILHVINQRDPNWWQAKREGEEESQLPGLIPSASFQQQKEAIKHTLAQDSEGMDNHRRSGFLCAKKSGRRKKNRQRQSPFDDNNPTDSMAEDVIAYEEVALYYPRSDRKRPVVLIGPPNIGRHELRQRFMQDGDRFAAAIPHTSRPRRPDEVDGRDYHFISRPQFEQDILARRFVEHGEYEKAYYGTSLDAIRAVVAAERICVLNLHPQSLRILKASDLMPFVVFVAPPSMEALRRWKVERSSKPVTDDDLRDIIESARHMETTYGHFFDMVIVYSDPERAYQELLREINLLEREPQWVPAAWVARNSAF